LSVQRDLERVRDVLKELAKRPDCAELTGFSQWAVRRWVETLERVLKRYGKEAKRVRKYYP